MKIAVVGCLHGKLNKIYEDVKECEKQQGFLIDCIIICGDFQAVRNQYDLNCMAVPDKYKELGDFHEYYSGKRQASHLTLVIGGNHEASNYFQTLHYGGWIAYNIYYMGYSSIVKLNGVRIAGISGIFKKIAAFKGYFEHLPFNQETMRSVYHTRYLEVFKMLQTREKLDVIFTHDWPLNIYKEPGAREYLLKKKKHFKNDMDSNQLGSPLYQILLDRVKPKHWFAAHYHIRFQTNYSHQSSSLDSKNIERTHFLALDKCKFRKTYLEIINVQSDEFDTSGLQYDLEWLAILKATNEFVSIQEIPSKKIPATHVFMNYDLDSLKEEIKIKFKDNFIIPKNFSISPPINLDGFDSDPPRKKNYTNPQTTKFCELLGVKDPIQNIINMINGKIYNPDRINLSDDEPIDWTDKFDNHKTERNTDNGSNDIVMTDLTANNSGAGLLSENQIEINGQIYDINNAIKSENHFFIDRSGTNLSIGDTDEISNTPAIDQESENHFYIDKSGTNVSIGDTVEISNTPAIDQESIQAIKCESLSEFNNIDAVNETIGNKSNKPNTAEDAINININNDSVDDNTNNSAIGSVDESTIENTNKISNIEVKVENNEPLNDCLNDKPNDKSNETVSGDIIDEETEPIIKRIKTEQPFFIDKCGTD